ncbi:choice-of-anchor B family protein [Euzebya tangerina]|uniref:choice-of-anchor B family protein n=1 Tax=Euzebya tangerina TaxID=591198 RepID=UPI000E324D6B|nr:choice-of-anchor B family protein [Euzebya tangerina]
MTRRSILFLIVAGVFLVAAPGAIAELTELSQGVSQGSGLSQFHQYTHIQASMSQRDVQSMPAANCVEGEATVTVDTATEVFACNNVDLLGHVSPGDLGFSFVNDIWGWTDGETGKDYALIGGIEGTTFVDFSDPTAPVVLGQLPTATATNSPFWRDIKVYADHAFVVSEDLGHGMQVFDLTQLRDVDPAAAPVTFTETALYTGTSSEPVGSSHNIAINTDSGFAYIVGTRSCGDDGAIENAPESNGGLHMVDISDPANPTFAGCAGAQGYVHDTQCVIYDGPDSDYTGREICLNSTAVEGDIGPMPSLFAAEERINTLSIVDVTDKSNPLILSNVEYDLEGYSHQGWLTQDHAHFLHGDELDEIVESNTDGSNQTVTRIWDVSDLDAPVLVEAVELGHVGIDHNMYVEGRYMTQSNYTNGLRVQDLVGVADGELTEVGFFDMFPEDDGRDPDGVVTTDDFPGTWSNWPYAAQPGVVAVSSIDRGLFILRPIAVDAGGPYAGDVGDQITLDASGSMDAEALNLTWDIDGDGEYDDATGINPTIDTSNLPPGDSTVFVRGSYDDGSAAVDSAPLTLNAGEPSGPGDPSDPGPDEPTTTVLPSQEESPDRSIVWSELAFPDGGADVVLIGRDDLFADSLASGGAQGTLNAPLLLTGTEGLDADVAAEIERLGASRAIILGGEVALSAQVATDLAAVVDTVDRVEGPTRLETAVDLADEITEDTPTDTVMLARAYPSDGDGDPTQAFADSLAAGGWAAEATIPVLLTQTDVLSAPTSAWLGAHGVTNVVVIGGEAAISADVVSSLESAGITVTRTEGPNRAGTATAIAAARGADTAADAAANILVDGAAEFGWTDAFPAALYASQELRPIVLTADDVIPPETTVYLTDGGTDLVCGTLTSTTACTAAGVLLGID